MVKLGNTLSNLERLKMNLSFLQAPLAIFAFCSIGIVAVYMEGKKDIEKEHTKIAQYKFRTDSLAFEEYKLKVEMSIEKFKNGN